MCIVLYKIRHFNSHHIVLYVVVPGFYYLRYAIIQLLLSHNGIYEVVMF